MGVRRLVLLALVSLCSLAGVGALGATAAAAAPPVVDEESVASVGYTAATLQAQVNPEGQAGSYHFEYGTSAAYGASAPVPDGAIAVVSGDKGVSRLVSGLQPGTTYHFRVVASNTDGTTNGPDHTFRTFALPDTTTDTCSNAQTRQAQFSSYLPDCRAYEQVSPAEKGVGGANIAAAPRGITQASLDGNAIEYVSVIAFGDAQGIEGRGESYASSRAPDAWTTHAITPSQESLPYGLRASSGYQAFSGDLSKAVYLGYKPIVDGHPNVAHVANLYLRTNVLSGPPGSYELLSDSSQLLPPQNAFVGNGEIVYVAASTDFSHILFESLHNLTPEASGFDPSLPKLYLWANGALSLAGILPDGTFAPESMPGRGSAAIGHTPGYSGRGTISSDGSRYVFLAPPFQEIHHQNVVDYYGDLYERAEGKTTLLNASERSTADPLGHQGAIFRGASSDESKVFFTSYELLTDNASGGGANGNAANLYMYDRDALPGKHLTLISVDDEPSDNNAEGCGCGAARGEYVALDGFSADGSYVYFLSGNRLVPGQPSLENHEELYVWHDGMVRAVTQHAEPGFGEVELGRANGFRMASGAHGRVAFVSVLESTARQAGVAIHGTEQVFVYDYQTNKLTCASCSPAGTDPTSGANFQEELDTNFTSIAAPYLTRPLSSDGRRVFFDTDGSLVPQDTNGKRDVYEYDVETGQLSLISGGTSAYDSTFVDASADGSDVFFTSRQQLVRADGDTASDLYDARIDGGIAAQNEASPAPCDGDDCQSPAKAAVSFSLAASLTFAGAGNLESPSQTPVKPRARSLTAAQKLAKALKACGHKPKHQRAACRAQARKRYRVRKATQPRLRAARPARRVGRLAQGAGRSVHSSHRAGR